MRDVRGMFLHSKCILTDVALYYRSPDSVAATKELYQSTWVATNEATCLKIETDLQMKLIATWNQVAASGRQFGVSLPYFRRRRD